MQLALGRTKSKQKSHVAKTLLVPCLNTSTAGLVDLSIMFVYIVPVPGYV